MTQETAAAGVAGAAQRALRIGFLSWAGIENLGNDACFEVMLDFIRRNFPDAQLISVGPGPERVEARFGIKGPNLRWLPKQRLWRAADKLLLKIPSAIVNWMISARTVRDLDFLIYPGTSLVDDYRTHALDRPLTMRRWFSQAKAAGVKIFYVSVGADPVRNHLARWVVKPMLLLSTYRSYRDDGSRAYLESIGLPEQDTPVYPDLVWGMPTPQAPARPKDGPPTVGIGLMAYHGWRSFAEGRETFEAYVGKMAAFADWLVEHGYKVRLLVGEKSDDRAVAAVTERAKSSRGPNWIHAPSALDIHELMDQIADTDVVVATRFHNIVCALKLGKPSISISYMNKCAELMTLAGTPEFTQDIEILDLNKLKRQFEDLIANRAALEQSIPLRVADVVARHREQEARLLKLLSR